jgi:hypothetical protein
VDELIAFVRSHSWRFWAFVLLLVVIGECGYWVLLQGGGHG